MARLEGDGFAFRGHFIDPDGPEEFCARRLLARIHQDSAAGRSHQGDAALCSALPMLRVVLVVAEKADSQWRMIDACCRGFLPGRDQLAVRDHDFIRRDEVERAPTPDIERGLRQTPTSEPDATRQAVDTSAVQEGQHDW